MSGKLYIAAAGSGKTTKIIKDIQNCQEKILVLTYTIKNMQQIKNRLFKECNRLLDNVEICTWISFLLVHGIRPYQGVMFDHRIDGICTIYNKDKRLTRDKKEYFVNKHNLIYSDFVSDCVIKLDDKNKGLIFKRLSKIYDCIYIDEVQDLVGYDWDILVRMLSVGIKVVMLGDPRQCVYTTNRNQNRKNGKYSHEELDKFLLDKKVDVEIDYTTLKYTYRNNDKICEFANSIYLNMPGVEVKRKAKDDTEGVFIIRNKDVDKYLEAYSPIQLGYNKKTKHNINYSYYNFGDVKGLEFNRVLIYATKNIKEWLINRELEMKGRTRAKFYVAVTRAKDSVVIVVDDDGDYGLPYVTI